MFLILFNNLLNNSYFSEKWKIAKEVPILKKGKNPHLVESYRPISLLPNLGKLFKVLINKSITRFVNVNQVIPYKQFGFRVKNSSIHAITKFTSDIGESLSENKFVAACLIDLERTFDSV